MIRVGTFYLVYWVSLSVICSASLAFGAGDELDVAVQKLFTSKCVLCHDDLKSGAGGDVDFLLKLDELASNYVDADSPEKSDLLEITSGDSPRMPKKRMKDIESKGPLTAEESQTLKAWVLRGGPSEEYRLATAIPERAIIKEEAIVTQIAADLGQLQGVELKNARYLTLTNLHNHRGVTDKELDVYRAAVVKTLNSLSRSTDVLGLDTSKAVYRLRAVDAERTIFRFDLRHLGWTRLDWESVIEYYPYALIQLKGNGRSVYGLTTSTLPYIRADWFVFASLQAPLYHDLVGIPEQLSTLETTLGIDRMQAIRDRRVARAGMSESKVSVNNRLLERIAMSQRAGAYHISYDFGSNDGDQNFFTHALGPVGAFKTEHAFRHDGGEVIFNLPNGFQAYALVTADGKRLDTAPQAIVADSTMPGGVIINGISCLSCHVQGMKPEAGDARLSELDKVLKAATDNRRLYSAAERELIGELYPSHDTFAALIEQDRERFLNALKLAGIEQKGGEEPARALFDRFSKDLDLNAVAGEFSLSPKECAEELGKESETRQILMRLERGQLKRQLYLAAFQEIANLTGAGDTREAKKLPFPYFGEKVPAPRPGVQLPPKPQSDISVDAPPSPPVNSMFGEKPGDNRSISDLAIKFSWCMPGLEQRAGFWVGCYEVTREEWEAVIKSTPWVGQKDVVEGKRIPATHISHAAVLDFCKRFTEEQRQKGKLPADWEYRLPSPLEWEVACRAGTASFYCYGDDEASLSEYAWSTSSSSNAGKNSAHEVGGKKPNTWGLHDMHGNVAEWCQAQPSSSTVTVRGGSWGDPARHCQSTSEKVSLTSHASSSIGFRLCLAPVKQ